MHNLWQMLIRAFNSQSESGLPQDNTVYRIETDHGKYCGRIIFQDDVVIRLRCTKNKPVKILKANIGKISTVKSETVEQYQQWLSSRPFNLTT